MSALYNSIQHLVHLSSCSSVWMRKYGFLSIIIILRNQRTTLLGVWPIGPLSLQWHDMRVVASQNTGSSSVCYTACSSVQQKTTQLRITCFSWGNSSGDRWIPSWRSSNAENIPWRDVFMIVPFCWHYWDPHLDHHGICYFSQLIAIVQMSKQNIRLWNL